MIFAQVGWGKGGYVEDGANDGSLSGAVLSPRDDEPGALASYASGLKRGFGRHGVSMVDPQFYVTMISGARDGNLPLYDYYTRSLTRASFDAVEVRRYAKQVLQFQSSLDVDRWVSPTVLFNSFNDPLSQVALLLAQASIAEWKSKKSGKPLLISLALDEQALRDRASLDEYLDAISTLDAKGFYLCVRRNDPSYPASYEEDVLVNLMYLTYVLGNRNSFEVVHGYTDIVGALLLAAGAEAICSGWYSNLRQFSLARFMPTTGGRSPRPRYTSRQLMNSIFVNPEMYQIAQAGKLADVISVTGYDTEMGNDPLKADWPRKASCLHHWKVLSNIGKTVTADKKVAERLTALEGLLKVAQATYSDLGSAGVTFEPMTGPREVTMWQRAVKRFRAEVGLR